MHCTESTISHTFITYRSISTIQSHPYQIHLKRLPIKNNIHSESSTFELTEIKPVQI